MTQKEEKQFQSSSTCWICEKLNDDEKVRDHCYITGKFRGAAHWSCNLAFIDHMQLMNSSLERLVKSVSGNEFKYLAREFGSKDLELLKQKDAYPYEYLNSFERF